MAITKQQATALVSKINAANDRFAKRKMVYQFWRTNCFLALGYSKLVKCVVELLQINESTFYRMLRAEQTAHNVCGNNICDDTLRVLAKLPSKQQKIAWQRAKTKAKIGHRNPTTNQVKEIVDQLSKDQTYFD